MQMVLGIRRLARGARGSVSVAHEMLKTVGQAAAQQYGKDQPAVLLVSASVNDNASDSRLDDCRERLSSLGAAGERDYFGNGECARADVQVGCWTGRQAAAPANDARGRLARARFSRSHVSVREDVQLLRVGSPTPAPGSSRAVCWVPCGARFV